MAQLLLRRAILTAMESGIIKIRILGKHVKGWRSGVVLNLKHWSHPIAFSNADLKNHHLMKITRCPFRGLRKGSRSAF